MTSLFKKILLRVLTIFTFCIGLLIVFMLNPSLSYAHQTIYKNVTIYHQQPLSPDWQNLIDTSLSAIQQTQLYDKNLKIDLCLNDGSVYPKVIKATLGNDIFKAFANKTVDLSQSTNQLSHIIAWGKRLKTTQFLTHAFIHNLQFKYHGFWDANPLGNHPNWKWEGYTEYETLGQTRTLDNIVSALEGEKDDFDWIELGNDERTLKMHVRYLAITKYCFDILKMDYDSFMKDKRTEETLFNEMLSAYEMK